MNWGKYFEMLIDWKQLPSYKAEPRIDSLVGFYIPEVMEHYFSIKVDGIIPEFPIRLGTIKPLHEGKSYSNKSYKVDFLVIGNNGFNYLVEFKSDSSSRRDEQDQYLVETKDVGSKKIIDGLLTIAKASSYKQKYDYLITKLQINGLLDRNLIYTGKNGDFKIVYIQPSNKSNEKNIIDYKYISEYLLSNYKESEFEKHLAYALQKWSID